MCPNELSGDMWDVSLSHSLSFLIKPKTFFHNFISLFAKFSRNPKFYITHFFGLMKTTLGSVMFISCARDGNSKRKENKMAENMAKKQRNKMFLALKEKQTFF